MDHEYKKKSVYEKHYTKEALSETVERYMSFLKFGKTERKCVEYTVAAAEKAGFVPFEDGGKYAPGDKVYIVNRDKAVCFVIFGKQPMTAGVHIAGAHIDSPRLDLKVSPLSEESGVLFLKTHYYGGIKKYQWTALPLALEGVVIRKDGSKVDVRRDDLTFCVSDLLPHLAGEQMKKTLAEGVAGEDLRVLAGLEPVKDGEKDSVKANILRLLFEEFGIEEEDLACAELTMVPKLEPALIGFDKSMVGAYGQDDRVCAFAAFEGLLDVKDVPEKTAITFLVDKEEVGSDGVTGMQGRFFERTLRRLSGGGDLLTICANSHCLSADVNAALDPIYPNVLDPQNACEMGYGPCITKYTGARGKSGTSDASAETMFYFISKMRQNDVTFQTGELGKVDVGGGGTIAKYMANRDIDTVDIGVGLLSMHAPYEISAVVDVFETKRAMTAFLK